MIRFACTSCGTRLIAKDNFVGRKTRCTRCKVRMEIPAENTPIESEDIEEDEEEENDAASESSEYQPHEGHSLGDFGDISPNAFSPVPESSPKPRRAESVCPLCSQTFFVLIDPASADQMVQCPHCACQLRMSKGPPAPPPVMPTAPVPTITFRCPHCQAAQTCTADFGGTVIKCSACKLPVQVPVPQGKIAAPPAQSQPASTNVIPQRSLVTRPEFLDLDRDDNRSVRGPVEKSSHVGKIVAGICIIITIILFMTGLFVFQEVRNENRREYERLMRKSDEMGEIIVGWTIAAENHERFIEDRQRDGFGKGIDMNAASMTIRDSRRKIADAEKDRRAIIRKAEALWPR